MMIDSFIQLEEPCLAMPDSNGSVGWVVRATGFFGNWMLNDIGKLQQSYRLDTEMSPGAALFYRTVAFFPTLILAERARRRYYIAHEEVENLPGFDEQQIMRFG